MLRFYKFFRVNFPFTLFCGVRGVRRDRPLLSIAFTPNTSKNQGVRGVRISDFLTPLTPPKNKVLGLKALLYMSLTPLTRLTPQNIRNVIFEGENMTEQSGRYRSTHECAERGQLYQECLKLLAQINRGPYYMKGLISARDALKTFAEYKQGRTNRDTADVSEWRVRS